MLSCEFCEISKNIFFYRTPLVVASKNVLLPGFTMTEMESVVKMCYTSLTIYAA